MKKKIPKENSSRFGISILNQNRDWDKDNQAWWDWYVSLADNSNSNINGDLLELTEPPNKRHPLKLILKKNYQNHLT